ncbi:MAG: replication initiation protein [Neisseriaceae bacterium]|nr:replication initiation protein [Neisseriaceae bacterium]
MSTSLVKNKGGGKLKNLQVIQSNTISRSAQGLSLVEKRILMSALAQTKGILKPVKLSAQEYADTFDLKSIDNAYRDLSSAGRNFMKRSFTIPSVTKKGSESEIHYNWLSYVRYAKREGYVEIKFNPDIYPLLFDLTEQFTKYQLKQASALRSIYSWRLLELFESVRKSKIIDKDKKGNTLHTEKSDTGWLKISVEEFNHAVETPKSYRNNFGIIKQKIILPAIKELEQKDGWKIEFNPIKKGRRVAVIEFNFYRNPQGRLF